MTTDLSDIETAIQIYFDGLYEGDTTKLSSVFHERASLFIEENGVLAVTPVPDWLARIARRPSPVSQKLPREDRILMIDRSGPLNACVKVQCQVAPKVYVDHLSLIKVEGRWQVVAKSYCQTATLS